jgi:hypothetical protein
MGMYNEWIGCVRLFQHLPSARAFGFRPLVLQETECTQLYPHGPGKPPSSSMSAHLSLVAVGRCTSSAPIVLSLSTISVADNGYVKTSAGFISPPIFLIHNVLSFTASCTQRIFVSKWRIFPMPDLLAIDVAVELST